MITAGPSNGDAGSSHSTTPAFVKAALKRVAETEAGVESQSPAFEPLLDADAIREALALPSNRAVYRLLESGALPVVRINRKIRVTPQALRDYVEAQTVAAKAGV